MNLSFISKGIVCLLSLGSVAHATVSPDRTRIIFNASAKSVSVKLTNQSKTDPYLAQSWIEDKTGKKTRGMWIAAELGGDFPFRRGRWKRFRRVEMEKWTWN